ncbi:MAG: hypothetical protein JW922_01810 [Paludibacteraceae bacterium]|nr:hypothetical protein [Paludibacteraceae bacterium]
MIKNIIILILLSVVVYLFVSNQKNILSDRAVSPERAASSEQVASLDQDAKPDKTTSPDQTPKVVEKKSAGKNALNLSGRGLEKLPQEVLTNTSLE